MKRPVPEAHITSPPQSVSMPRMALPISSSYCPLMLSFSLCRSDPNQRYTQRPTNRAAEINCETTSLP